MSGRTTVNQLLGFADQPQARPALPEVLSIEELDQVMGGYDRALFIEGRNEVVAAIGGVIFAGIAVTTAPISFPLAVFGSLTAAAVGGFAAAEGTEKIMSSGYPDSDAISGNFEQAATQFERAREFAAEASDQEIRDAAAASDDGDHEDTTPTTQYGPPPPPAYSPPPAPRPNTPSSYGSYGHGSHY